MDVAPDNTQSFPRIYMYGPSKFAFRDKKIRGKRIPII